MSKRSHYATLLCSLSVLATGRPALAETAALSPVAPQASWIRGASDPEESAAILDRVERRKRERAREAWLLTAEAVTRAPLDVGVQAGLELPVGLRLFGGAGWMPAQYSGMLAGAAASFSGDPLVKSMLEDADFSGTTWHAQVGLRPFKNVGAYFDAGYTTVSLQGSFELSGSDVPELSLMPGGYEMQSTLHLWTAELGYQAQIADRILIGVGVGAMGVFHSQTRFAATDGALSLPELDEAAGAVDETLTTYGTVPTLTLRLGVDVI